MSYKVINDILESLGLQVGTIEKLPFTVVLDRNIAIIISDSIFDQWCFTVLIHNDGATQWEDSDIVEYFLDDETQFFLKNNMISINRSQISLGFTKSINPEKIQVFEIVDLIKLKKSELNRFVDEYTAI